MEKNQLIYIDLNHGNKIYKMKELKYLETDINN